MILTGGLGYGGGLVARGYGAIVGGVAPPEVIPAPSVGIGRRDMRKKRRAEIERQTRRRREIEFFLVGMP
jgi:hypothetical protein